MGSPLESSQKKIGNKNDIKVIIQKISHPRRGAPPWNFAQKPMTLHAPPPPKGFWQKIPNSCQPINYRLIENEKQQPKRNQKINKDFVARTLNLTFLFK